MVVCRQDLLYKDYTSNPSLHLLLNLTSFCGLCYETTGKSTSKQQNDVGMGLLVGGKPEQAPHWQYRAMQSSGIYIHVCMERLGNIFGEP